MKYKLVLGTGLGFDVSPKEEIRLIKKAGFDGFFTDWNTRENILEFARIAKEENLFFQSIHAPFGDMHLMWEGSEDEANEALDELKQNVDICCEAGVGILVCHVIIGMERHTPNKSGAMRFKSLAEYAKVKGIKIAFENTEGSEYLKAVLDECKDLDNVGFCFDSGHEKCYNVGQDMLSLYSDRLIATHLNDNLGATDENNITWLDDLHLMPFDGNADWESITERLKKSTCPEYLTFELLVKNKPGRHEHDIYSDKTCFEYICEVYKRADKIRTMMEI